MSKFDERDRLLRSDRPYFSDEPSDDDVFMHRQMEKHKVRHANEVIVQALLGILASQAHMEEQDRALDDVHSHIQRLAVIGEHIHSEIGQQNEYEIGN